MLSSKVRKKTRVRQCLNTTSHLTHHLDPAQHDGIQMVIQMQIQMVLSGKVEASQKEDTDEKVSKYDHSPSSPSVSKTQRHKDKDTKTRVRRHLNTTSHLALHLYPAHHDHQLPLSGVMTV